MDIIIIMGVGILVGMFLIPKQNKICQYIIKISQTVTTLILIFSMGALLGRKENFLNDLLNLGFTSFVLFLIPTVLSIILVYFLTKKFLYKKKEDKQ